MIHEELSREESVTGSSERSFGFVFAAVFAIVGALPLFQGGIAAMRLWAFVVAGAFLVLALGWTTPLQPLNRLWLKFGLVLHSIVSPLILALLFFATITPIAFLLRLFGKDLLHLEFDPDVASYWIERQPPGPAPESMKNQY